MFEQAPASPGPGYGYAAATPPTRPVLPAYDLRPLTTGEILDRTFSLYRQRFWLYCGLSAIAAGFVTLASLGQMIWMDTIQTAARDPRTGSGAAAAPVFGKAAIIGGVITLVALLLHLVAYSITQAATVSAVSSVYLGHETSMGTAFKAVRRFWLRYIGIALWQGWSSIWVFLLLFIPAVMLGRLGVSAEAVGFFFIFSGIAGLIYGVIAYIRNSLAVPASVFEGLKVRKSMRRSKTLAAQTKWRIFLLFLLLVVLSFAAGILQAPLSFMLIAAHGGQRFAVQGLSLAMAFVTNSLIGPIGAIGLCLFYFDQRVRKEGFDIEALMDGTLGSARPAFAMPAAPVTELLPSGFAPSGFTASSSPFPPSGLTATEAPPFPPSGLTASSEPFPPSGLTASPTPFPPSGFTSPVSTPDPEQK